MSFEQHLDNQVEMDMLEQFTCSIGNLVPNKDVNLEELCNHPVDSLRHLYRFMVENPELELRRVDDLMLYFYFIKCGHEFCMPWMGLVDNVTEMIKDNDLIQKCKLCRPVKQDEPVKTEKEKALQLTKEDMKNADGLVFMFVRPIEEMKLGDKKLRQVKSLAARCETRLAAYKQACADGNANQAKNAGLALKNGLVEMRKMGIPAAVKFSQ